MAHRDGRLRRATISGIKLGLSCAAVLATAAGWALFGAADRNGVTTPLESMALVEQAAPQVSPPDLFQRHDEREHRRGQSQAPEQAAGEGDAAGSASGNQSVQPPAEQDQDDDDAQPQPGTGQQAIPPSSSSGSQGIAPAPGNQQAIPPSSSSGSQPSQPRRPITRTRSSR